MVDAQDFFNACQACLRQSKWENLKSHGDAIHSLGLPAGAVGDALSLRQIRVESKIRYLS